MEYVFGFVFFPLNSKSLLTSFPKAPCGHQAAEKVEPRGGEREKGAPDFPSPAHTNPLCRGFSEDKPRAASFLSPAWRLTGF